MSLRSFIPKPIADFRGMWVARTQTRQSASRASYAQNVRFGIGGVRSRKGMSEALDLGAGAIRSLYNWISSGDPYISGTSRLFYLEDPNIVGMYDLTLSALLPLYSQTCYGISVAEAETRAYIAHYNSAGEATGQVKVVNSLLGGAPADDAFPDPLTTVPTVTEVGAGGVDAGVHYVAYRLETRSGFPGKPGPIVAGVFSPVAITVNPGGKELQFAMLLNVPSDGAIIHTLMTSVDDPDTFYEVPNGSIAVPAGSTGWPVVISIDVSDAALAIDLNDATDRFSYLTGSSAPRPSKIARYGNRTVYIASKKAYISDPYNAQVLVEDLHAVQVEGQRSIVTAEPLGPLLVIYALNSTFVLSGDNSRYPRQWAPPQRRSDSIGTPAINGVIPAAGMDGHWVTHQSGLHFFNGSYSDIPVSIGFENDWKRINWAYANSIQGVDDPEARCLFLNVPLDGATSPNYRMVIDYSRARAQGGVDPYNVDYSLDVYKVGGTVTAIHSIARVRNETTKQNEVWMGRGNGTVLKVDEDVIADDGEPVHAIWETGLVLQQKLRQISRFAGIHFDGKGSGNLTVTPYGLNKQVTADTAPRAVALTAAPSGEKESRWHLESENQSIRFETNSTTASFEISGITVYHKPVGTARG